MNFKALFVTGLAFLGLSVIHAQAADNGFPGRVKYPDVKVYEKATLSQMLPQVVVVDARSSLEFDTLRIKGAVNIPVASKDFEAQVRNLHASTGKPIVFYCNGRTCMKSYIAARKARTAKVADVYAYDAGMFEWAETYPDHAELLGKSPVRREDIISLASYKKHLLSPDDFSNKAHELGTRSVILDVRDKFQRGATGLFPGIERWVSLDRQAEIRRTIEQAKQSNKTLFIYDEVGRQVKWLQYTLRRENFNNFYFMHNGAKAYYAQMMQEFGIGSGKYR